MTSGTHRAREPWAAGVGDAIIVVGDTSKLYIGVDGYMFSQGPRPFQLLRFTPFHFVSLRFTFVCQHKVVSCFGHFLSRRFVDSK